MSEEISQCRYFAASLFISKRNNYNMLMSCHPIISALLCPYDLAITWAGEDLGEKWGTDFSPNLWDFAEFS